MGHKFSRLTKFGAVAAVAALALTGCSNGDGSGATTAAPEGESKGAIAMSFAGLTVQIWNDMLPFQEEIITDAGYEFITHDPAWDPQAQVSDWESWIVRGDVKAIMGYPAQSDAMVAVTQQAADAGIPVVAYGSTWDGVQAAVYFDHLEDGRMMGETAVEWIKETYPDEQVDVALLGYPDTDLGRLRAEGIRAALDDSGLDLNINEHKTLTVDDGYAAVQNQLNAFPDTKVWLSISNDMALGAYQALLDQGTDPQDDGVLLAHLDGTDAELEIIAEEGSFWRFVYMTPAREIAERTAQMMIDAAEGNPLEDEILPLTLVTSENAEQYFLENQ
ncbi:sugar ABC transporter substrate-binding protein [Leucobacter chironomi]|uniref:sugar ABC transporter substrate-binding protein n=1 Tax=Leucobacter chironomi TaxID=491918 RepID=UPI0003F4E250|nr:sugar ABC transporter substrate-binding protein [Leucobacter chironomi]